MSVSMTRCGWPRACGEEVVPADDRLAGQVAAGSWPSSTTSVRRSGHCASSSASSPRRWAVVTSTRTAQSRRMWPTCGGFSSGLTGTNTPPAIVAPKIVATVSGRLGR